MCLSTLLAVTTLFVKRERLLLMHLDTPFNSSELVIEIYFIDIEVVTFWAQV